MPKTGPSHTCLEVFMIDSALKKMKIIMRKCFKRIQMHWKRHITEDLETPSMSDVICRSYMREMVWYIFKNYLFTAA